MSKKLTKCSKIISRFNFLDSHWCVVFFLRYFLVYFFDTSVRLVKTCPNVRNINQVHSTLKNHLKMQVYVFLDWYWLHLFHQNFLLPSRASLGKVDAQIWSKMSKRFIMFKSLIMLVDIPCYIGIYECCLFHGILTLLWPL